ncbi:hypothetical protein BEP19_09700 [Ammoniphilus oxalaticus]|uniref:Isoprenylcysteine carboxyl methyltransferase n=1 Tax=Ammoniphilus oxalaticus TaxID=66863 RepID=A0A419SL52_9BACL|nr:isoprenylcysteine carboxylmethyltransferase family protein [Ammoniphilus oxalaticus]RKD24638.1 hypothetical protein BEP19_09700 [Ammoniphilus oxalaticus]
MSTFFLFLYALLITQRLLELRVAKRNSNWMESRGGTEVGQGHYKYIVLIHVGFLASLFGEVALAPTAGLPVWWALPFGLFLAAQVLRYWCIQSLGRFWNTRIYTIPNEPLVKKGPYRWLKHPNYLIVMTEMISFPLIFGAYTTALVWSGINLLFLKFVRIPIEEQALQIRAENQD